MDYQPKKKAKTSKVSDEDIAEGFRKIISKKIFNVKSGKFTQWQYKNYGSDVLGYICKVIEGGNDYSLH